MCWAQEILQPQKKCLLRHFLEKQRPSAFTFFAKKSHGLENSLCTFVSYTEKFWPLRHLFLKTVIFPLIMITAKLHKNTAKPHKNCKNSSLVDQEKNLDYFRILHEENFPHRKTHHLFASLHVLTWSRIFCYSMPS